MDMKYLPNLPLSVKGGQPGVGGVLKKREHLILLLYHFSSESEFPGLLDWRLLTSQHPSAGLLVT